MPTVDCGGCFATLARRSVQGEASDVAHRDAIDGLWLGPVPLVSSSSWPFPDADHDTQGRAIPAKSLSTRFKYRILWLCVAVV
jgi:hypothetical protein